MKKILFVAILLLSLTVCLASPVWAGGSDDAKAGDTAYQEGNYDRAIKLFTKAIASGELSRKDLSITYLNRGLTWGKKGDYDKAITDFDKAIGINPKFAYAYGNRGLTWAKKGDYDKAIADYTKAIEINPRDADAYGSRGNAWYDKGDYDKAIADYTKVIEIDPRDADAYGNRGNAWGKKGDYDKVIADYTKAIEINPRNANAYGSRGYAWGKKGDYDKVIADYTKAIEIDPKFADAYNGLAWIMATCPEGKYRDGKRAVELAEKAVALKDAASFLDTLAAAYAEAGRFQDAIKTQERVITKLKQESGTQYLPQCEKHLSSYKAGKPWREK